MALEDLTGATKYLSALNPANPDPLDAKSQGDDHIRGIKNVLLNTFGAVAAPVPVANAAIKNIAQVITGQWSFSVNAKFTDTSSHEGVNPFAYFNNTTPSTGRNWSIQSQTDGSFIAYNNTNGVFGWVVKLNGDLEIRNRAGAQQRAGWQPLLNQFGASATLGPANAGQTCSADAAGITFTIPASGFVTGDIISVITTFGAPCTIAAVGGVNLQWYKGGSQSLGNRTVAGYSRVSLFCYSSSSWIIDGSGIS